MAFGTATILGARPHAPDWMVAAGERATPANVGLASAVVLLDESTVEVQTDGTFECNQRRVIRILRGDGRDYARAAADYVQGAGKVKALRAWLVAAADGEVTEFGKKELVDVAVNAGALELYGENHRQVLTGISTQVKVGDLFAFEAETVDRMDFAEIGWGFDAPLPVVESAVSVALPPGWGLQAHFSHHAEFAPEQRGAWSTWRLRDLPARRDEAFTPEDEAGAIAVHVTLDPPDNLRRTSRVIGHATWTELAAFLEPDYDAASTPTPDLVAKARAATAGADSRWKQIEALCEVAQRVRYISIGLNVGHSGGYRPRAASDVERVGYGDCKDKSTYLRALLRAVDLEGYALLVSAQGRLEIDPDWVSPQQFNHCILAIPVDDSVPADVPLIDHPTLGRLFVFDPTDEHTPPGWLAGEYLSRQAFLLSASRGGVVAMPALRPDRSGRRRTVTCTLDRNGAIQGEVKETMLGRDAVRSRRIRADRSATEYDQRISDGLGVRLSAPVVEGTTVVDDIARNRFELSYQFRGEAYGKTMRDVLLMFQPVAYPQALPRFKPSERQQPIFFDGQNLTETTTFVLPAGFVIDELPEDADVESEFGHFQLTVTPNENETELTVARRFSLNHGEWPAARAEALQTFFAAVREAEQTPVVLAREE